MTFGNAEVVRADVEFRANTAGFTGDMALIRSEAERTFGALDATTLKAALASEKYDRALARSKGSTFAVARATAAYKAELASIDATTKRATSSTGRHSNALRQEEQSLGRMARGALAGSGALGHLGRAAVFASTSLLGGYGLVYALRSTINAARDHEVAQGHLQVSLKDSGLSWDRYGQKVTAALDEQIKATGFANTDLTESLSNFVRRFGDVDQALRANAIAADVARAKNVSLAEAQSLVQRASFGNPRALRALGIELTKTSANMDQLKASTRHASAEQIANAKAADLQKNQLGALDAIQAKYHGNAARYLTTDAGKQALFNAELEHSKEIIGQGLLPTFNHLLIRFTAWLEKMNQGKRLQHDVNVAVHDASIGFHVLGEGIHAVAPPLKVLNTALGGTKHSIELLGLALLAFKLRGFATIFTSIAAAIAGIGSAAATATPEVVALADAEAAAAAGAGAAGAAGVAGLAARVLPFTPFITAAIANYGLSVETKSRPGPKLLGHKTRIEGKGVFDVKVGNSRYLQYDNGKWYDTETGNEISASEAAKRLGVSAAALSAQMTPVKNTSGMSNDPMHDAGGGNRTPSAPSRRRGRGGGPPPVVTGLTYAQQNKLLVAEGTTSTADDVAVLNNEVSFLNNALKQKGLTPQETNELLNARNQALSQLQSIQQAGASSASSAASKAAAAQRRRFLALTAIPSRLVRDEAHAESSHASTSKILQLLRQEEAALRRQEGELRRQGAPSEFEARVAKNEESVQKHIDRVVKAARKRRIGALEGIPVELKLAEASARARNASEQTILEILKKEHAALESQIATLRKIGASKEEILKARQAEAAVQAKINSAQKAGRGDFGSLEREFLTGVENLAQYRGNVFAGTINQNFPSPPTSDGHREAIYARRAMQAQFDG